MDTTSNDHIKRLIEQGRRDLGRSLPTPTLSEKSPGLSASSRTVKAVTRQPDACPVCGFPADEPGYLRKPDGGNSLADLIPCPECNAGKIAERAKVQHQLEGQLREKTFANFAITDGNKLAYDAALEFSRQPLSFLTLWGEYGPGKTHLLAAITNAIGGAKYFTMPDLVSRYREAVGLNDVEGFYNRISRIKVLVVDEIDKADLKGWTREQTYRLFDYRYRHLNTLGTVLAMNYSPEEADDNFGYLFSRMKDERCKVIYVGGGDNRGRQSFLGRLAGLQRAA